MGYVSSRKSQVGDASWCHSSSWCGQLIRIVPEKCWEKHFEKANSQWFNVVFRIKMEGSGHAAFSDTPTWFLGATSQQIWGMLFLTQQRANCSTPLGLLRGFLGGVQAAVGFLSKNLRNLSLKPFGRILTLTCLDVELETFHPFLAELLLSCCLACDRSESSNH